MRNVKSECVHRWSVSFIYAQYSLISVPLYMLNLYQNHQLTKALIKNENLDQCVLAFWLCIKVGTRYAAVSPESFSHVISESKIQKCLCAAILRRFRFSQEKVSTKRQDKVLREREEKILSKRQDTWSKIKTSLPATARREMHPILHPNWLVKRPFLLFSSQARGSAWAFFHLSPKVTHYLRSGEVFLPTSPNKNEAKIFTLDAAWKNVGGFLFLARHSGNQGMKRPCE